MLHTALFGVVCTIYIKKKYMGRKLELSEVIKRFRNIHGERYDYSLINEYKNNRTLIPIVCKEHGVFYQRTDKHLLGHGCPLCSKNKKLTTETFIEKAKKVHGDKYDYSKVNYITNDIKVCIICSKHGEFWQTPHMHLFGQGCPKCHGNEKKTTEKYIQECKKVHGDKYDYSKTIYKNAFSPVIIICPKHGEYTQIARTHLYGHGCPECAGKRKYDLVYFLEKAKNVHGNKYDYSLIKEIKNNRELLPIICPKHGIFYQTIDNHINQKQGCPNCMKSHLENDVAHFLNENNITFFVKKKFKWLGKQHLDFFLPEYNIAIECQGEQHFIPSNFGSKKKTKEECFKRTIELDKKKKELCIKNNVKILYFANKNTKSLSKEIITDYKTLLLEIKH